jgi:hypothetical protein
MGHTYNSRSRSSSNWITVGDAHPHRSHEGAGLCAVTPVPGLMRTTPETAPVCGTRTGTTGQRSGSADQVFRPTAQPPTSPRNRAVLRMEGD